jgi:NAD(P)H-nitrite reductase large subunit
MSRNRIRRYLIIGNGIAGLKAAETIRGQDGKAGITLISDEPHGFYSRPGLAYFLAGEVPEDMLFSRGQKAYQQLNLRLIHGRVEKLMPAQAQVVLGNGEMFEYDALLLATGARAVRPQIPGVDLGGVLTLDTLDDVREVLRFSRRARQAVVVGGGITALEIVEGLCSRGLEVHYLLRKDRYWNSVLDLQESNLIEMALLKRGIRLHHNSQLKQILGKKGRVAGVELIEGDRLACQLVGIAVGIQPRLNLALEAGLQVDRGILVDETMKTNDPRIFAAGDVAQVFDPVVGRYVLDSLWNAALEQGRIAGMNMAGVREELSRGVPFNVTRLAGVVTTIIGVVGQGDTDHDLVAIARGDSETWRVKPEAFVAGETDSTDRIRVLGYQNRLTGAVVMGDQTLSRPLQHLIATGADISPIRQQLLDNPQDLCGTLFRFWEGWSAGRAA